MLRSMTKTTPSTIKRPYAALPYAYARRLRRKRLWTQAELAKRLGVDVMTVSRWERGVSKPRRAALRKILALDGRK